LRLFKFAALLPILLCVSTEASAEPRLLEVPTRYLVIPPMEAGSKRITKNDLAFEFALRWESAAVLAQDVAVAVDDRRQTFARGQALVETRLQFADPVFASAKSFCAPRVANPSSKLGGLLLGRSLADGQFCLIDREGDSTAEFSVLVNAGTPAAREPRPIAPVPYTLTPGAIVSEGDSVKLRYRGGRDSFELQIIQQGQARDFQTFEYRDRDGRHRFSRWLFGDKVADGVFAVQMPGMQFKISGYDPTSNSALIEWPRTERPAIVPIPDDVKLRYFGY